MKLDSAVIRFVNILARVVGLSFTAAGVYFALQGIYYLIQPEAAGARDILGFSPSFRPFVIATILLIIGVHFLRGEAHRPDLQSKNQTSTPLSGRRQSWWTGEPLDKKPE